MNTWKTAEYRNTQVIVAKVSTSKAGDPGITVSPRLTDVLRKDTSYPSVSKLLMGEMASLICSF